MSGLIRLNFVVRSFVQMSYTFVHLNALITILLGIMLNTRSFFYYNKIRLVCIRFSFYLSYFYNSSFANSIYYRDIRRKVFDTSDATFGTGQPAGNYFKCQ